MAVTVPAWRRLLRNEIIMTVCMDYESVLSSLSHSIFIVLSPVSGAKESM